MYNKKINLRLFSYQNNSFVQIAIIDDFREISWENNLYEAGQFSISINYNIPNSKLFQRGLFVQFGDDPYAFGEITKIQDSIGEDGKGGQTRIITGFDIRYILKRRVIKNMNSNGLWVMTAKGELCLRNLIKDQCGSGAETKRRLPIINNIPDSANAIGKEFSVSEQFSNLYEVCKTIATQSEIGWRMKFYSGNLTLECYSGENKSQTVKFDTDYDSLSNGQFIDSSESFSNAIYVGGKGQNEGRDIYEGESAIGGNSPSGLDRFESWDNQSQMTIQSEYETEALSMLTQYGQTIQMQGNGLAKSPYIYKEQYNVGDIITVAFSGKSAAVQILSVTEHWSWGNYEIQFEFGKPQPNLNDQLQLILRKIQEASNKTDSTESVKWYTMNNNIIMDKKDVTYNTIGFTGTLTANRTFRFYRDNQKTGSKNYTVYVKNLSGNYTLTLTTARLGMSNVVLKGGTNVVARILVDEDGNIVNQGMTATSIIEEGNSQPVTSNAVATSNAMPVDTVTSGNMHSVTSNAVNSAIEDITKNTISKALNQAGWYKICSCAYYSYGSALKIFLTSLYNYIPCVSHSIDVVYGWVNPKISETCYDNYSVFDKLMITYESNNACNIFVHYNRNDYNNCGLKIIGSSWGILQTFNFEPADISGFTDYAIFNLGTNGFYINGTNQDVVSSTTVNIAHHLGYASLYKIGKVVFFSLSSDWTGLDAGLVNVGNIPQGYRPIDMVKMSEASLVHILMEIYPEGVINIYNYDGAFDYARNGNYFACWITNE